MKNALLLVEATELLSESWIQRFQDCQFLTGSLCISQRHVGYAKVVMRLRVVGLQAYGLFEIFELKLRMNALHL